jgi:hypothetical protein
MSDIEREIKALQMIQDDMERDATELDGKPFNGTTVSVALGRIMAAVSAMANITAQHLEAHQVRTPNG